MDQLWHAEINAEHGQAQNTSGILTEWTPCSKLSATMWLIDNNTIKRYVDMFVPPAATSLIPSDTQNKNNI